MPPQHSGRATKHYTVAECFTSFVLPHLLFVPDYGERHKAVLTACLAWNIGLFPDPAERERHIQTVWGMVEADNLEPPPPGLEQGYKNDLRMLTEHKRDLFPWLATNIPKVELVQGGKYEALKIQAGKSAIEDIKLVIWPDPLGLPLIVDVLRGIQRDTAGQAALMESVRDNPGQLSDIDRTVAATAYCVQRADLIVYRRMLTVWQAMQPEPSVRGVIGNWLEALNEIDEDSKLVL